MSAGAPIRAGLAKETRVSKSVYVRARLWCVLLLLGFATQSIAEGFRISDIRIEGLQRITAGTVFNYLPINVGDRVDDIRIGEAIRALYGQSLFDDIEMRRDGDTLVVVVRERPSIESFTIEGNKDIKTEDLMDSLRSVGLARGRTFDRSVLDNVEMFLREQYYDRGKYGVVIDSDIQQRPNNTVRIQVNVKEGDRAKIRQVNIVGNTEFSDKEIREDFNLDTANWLSWIRQDDRYEKEGLEGDLEKGLSWLERATSLSPNYAQGIYAFDWTETMAGSTDDAREHVNLAMRLSPLDPLYYAMLGARGFTHIARGEYAEAVAWTDQAARSPGAHVFMALLAAFQLLLMRMSSSRDVTVGSPVAGSHATTPASVAAHRMPSRPSARSLTRSAAPGSAAGSASVVVDEAGGGGVATEVVVVEPSPSPLIVANARSGTSSVDRSGAISIAVVIGSAPPNSFR